MFSFVCRTLGRSYTFGLYIERSCQQQYQFVCLNNLESILSGLCYNAADPEPPAVRDIGATCDLGNKSQAARLSPRHLLGPGGPYRTLNADWFLSFALLRGIQIIRLCRNAKTNQSCIGLLFQYQTKSCQTAGKWRWDHNIDQTQLTVDESALIYCQNDHTRSRTLAVEIRVSAINTVSYDDTWEYLPLQGQLIWWFASFGNYVIFLDID